MIKVTNTSKRAQVYNLPHDVICKTTCSCADHVHRQLQHNPATGDVGYRDLQIKLSGSVHLQPGACAELPDAAESAPEIVSAKARSEVRIDRVASAPASASKPSA